MKSAHLPTFLLPQITLWKQKWFRRARAFLRLGGLLALALLVLEHGGLIHEKEWAGTLSLAGWTLVFAWALLFLTSSLMNDRPERYLQQHAGHLLTACAFLVYQLSEAQAFSLPWRSFLSGPQQHRWMFLSLVALLEGISAVAKAIQHQAAPLAGLKRWRPSPLSIMLLSFPLLILVGAFFLMLPKSRGAGAPSISWYDALFTATSAVCVTGLVVRDTAVDFSRYGQNVILALIQIGGLGIVTFATFFTLILGGASDLGQQSAMKDLFSGRSLRQAIQVVLFIVLATAAIELAGAFLLMDAWELPPGVRESDRFRFSLFHSISAFCNAGFSLHSNGLEGYAYNWKVMAGMGGLIFLGGIGFSTLQEILSARVGRLWSFLTRPHTLAGARASFPGLTLQTRICLRISLFLIAAGAILVFFGEHAHTLSGIPAEKDRCANALFLSVSARTAGFNTFSLAALADATIFGMILLMFIGACPSSTGGGIKTTTAAVLYSTVRALWKNKEEVEIARKTIPQRVVQSAFVILILAGLIVAATTFLLCLLEPDKKFSHLLFEATSAFGTVGLSIGVTPHLGVGAKLLLCLTMLLGRLGPLSIMVAMAQRKSTGRYTYATETVAVG